MRVFDNEMKFNKRRDKNMSLDKVDKAEETITIDTVNENGLPIRTIIERTHADVVTITEGLIREDCMSVISCYNEVIFSGVKLKKLREFLCNKKRGIKDANNKRKRS